MTTAEDDRARQALSAAPAPVVTESGTRPANAKALRPTRLDIEVPVFARFARHAQARPNAIAVIDQAGATTYGELLQQALRIGSALAVRTAADEPVVIALPTGAACVAALLGALAAGRPSVPIDLSHPTERQAHIIRHSGARVILSTSELAGSIVNRLAAAAANGEKTDLVAVDSLPPVAAWDPVGTAASLAWIFYTSGSTGTPKGVFQNQRGLACDVLQYGETVVIGPDDVLSGLYSPSVIGSTRDIHAALCFGATVVLLDVRAIGANAVVSALAERRVTILHAMPPVFRLLFGHRAQSLSDVRVVYLAGDRLFASDLALVRRIAPCARGKVATGSRFLNDRVAGIYTGIGSTECSTLYRHWFVPDDWPADDGQLPVGRTIAGRTTSILREDNNLAEPGETGRIAVTSRYLALGYWRDPERTASSFRIAADDPTLRTFIPGDLGAIGDDDLLLFQGRADRQVKIRGYLVDPGQIEAALRSLPGVIDAACVVVGQGSAMPTIKAFVELEPGRTTQHCREELVARYPALVAPGHFEQRDRLPRLANFKVNYAALGPASDVIGAEVRADPDAAGMDAAQALGSASDSSLSRTELATLLSRTVGGLLQLASVPEAIPLADLGADSLQRLELQAVLEQRLRRPLPHALFDGSLTLAQLAAAISQLPEWNAAADQGVHYVVFPALRGPSVHEYSLRDALGNPRYFTMLVYPAHFRQEIEPDIAELVDSVPLAGLAAAAAGRRLVFVGVSFGARVAYEAASRLAVAGDPLLGLVMIDTPLRRFYFPLRSLWRWPALVQRPIRYLANALAAGLGAGLQGLLTALYRRLSGATTPRLRRVRGISRRLVNFGTHRAWRPRPDFMPPALLVVSAHTRARHPSQRSDLGWADLCHNLTCREVVGTHDDICLAPRVGVTARVVTAFVQAELSVGASHLIDPQVAGGEG